MRPFTRKIGAVLLSHLLLFSTLSFTMDMHFCGKTLVDFSLFHEAEDCGMAMGDDLMAGLGCCSDVEVIVQGQEDLDQVVNPVDFHPQLVAVVMAVYQNWLGQPEHVQEPPRFHGYSPPPLFPDITIRDQRFLI